MIRRIVILGPESTGKSSLCEALARHYQTTWVPEFAREYLLKNGTTYSYDDLLLIAKEQVAQEDRMAQLSTNGLLFIDTDLYVMKVWCEFVFGSCHQWILDRIAERQYDCYLLCHTDLPWVKDRLREYPDQQTRDILFNVYKDHMINQQTPWKEIRGNYEERLLLATEMINNLAGK